MNRQRFRNVALAFSVAAILSCSPGSSALGAEQGSQAGPILEPIEWTDIWVTNANRNDLPRVLFVGDSITRGYFKSAEKQLDGQANCARYATSAFIAHEDFLEGLKILLERYDFDVIHINNGLHGWDYTEEEYRSGFPPLIKLLKERAPKATIIWATTTPIRQRGAAGKLKEESTERVRQRNQIAAEFVKENHFGTADLFALVIDHPEYFGSGGVHFNSKGIGVQGEYVAGVVGQALKSRESKAASPAAKVDTAASKRSTAERKIGVRELKSVAPKLPNVLLVGDSICSGYNGQVRKLLEGKANVYAWVTGMNLRRANIKEMQKIALGTAKFDVVHFNIGLHGLGDRIPEEEYEPLLRKYVRNYQVDAKNAKLIWASTTPIWDPKTNQLSPGNAKIVKRNKIAEQIMQEAAIPVTDLYSAVVDKLELGGGIHWSKAGYGIMAAAIAKNIKAALAPPFVVARVSVADTRPNIILVMADDLGIGDITPTNPDCKIKTPNLQKMAREGITFFDAHTPSAVCTPTRYGLLTGRYNWRSRLARGVLSGRSPHLIPADRPTLGHLMRQAGYHTAMLGKWHLGWDWHKQGNKIDFTQPVNNGPDINGFDQYYAHCGSLDMPPYVWVDSGRVTAQPDRQEGVTKKEDRYGWYRQGPIGSDFKMDRVLPQLFDKSIAHIKERAAAARSGKPFFLYLALPAPHTPILPIPPFKGASQLNPYGDYVIEVDHYMGQILAAVKETGLDDNTLVIFTSDNGCSPEANFELLKSKGHDPSAGYRGYKADIYEGGHRVPLIVRWPGHIKGGRTTKALACLTDIYPTLEEITGQRRQARGGEDGFSLLAVLNGANSSRRETLISHSVSGKFAIRQGTWKLCLCYGSGGWSAPRDSAAKKQGLPPLQLFNLEEDPGEQNNLVAQYPDKVAMLLKLLDQQIQNGRCTPGEVLLNDRAIEFLPKGVVIPGAKSVSPLRLSASFVPLR